MQRERFCETDTNGERVHEMGVNLHNDGNTEDRPLDGLIYRLWVCDNEHTPISFFAREREACPLCDTKGLHKCLEEEARHYQDGQEFYRGIVTQIGELFGDSAKTSDDGSFQDHVLALQVYPLVKQALHKLDALVDDGWRPRRRLHRVRRRNPIRRGKSSASAALILGACAGFIAGIFKRGDK